MTDGREFDRQEAYRIKVKGCLEERWTDWFDGFTITLLANGETLLSGWVVDQCALYGLLAKIRDLDLPLLLVERLGDESSAAHPVDGGAARAHSEDVTETEDGVAMAHHSRKEVASKPWGFVIWLLLLLVILPTGCRQTPIASVPPTMGETAVPPTPTLAVPTATSIPTASPTATPEAPTPVPTDTLVPTPATRVVTTDGGYTVTFEPSACPIEIPGTYAYECGTLIVPEDRSKPEGAQVSLQVLIFRSTNADPRPDPVIYLTGGGGTNQLETEQIKWYKGVIDGILADRDFIFYNQRGVTFTEPALTCPGYADLVQGLMGQSEGWVERYAAQRDFWLECQDDLLAQGIDLNMYNSAVNAADANDLRVALGYEEANYYGTSYGTRFGLDLIRDFPEGVRSIILDSVYPPQVDYYSEYALDAVRAFNEVFESCRADTACRARYPDLETTFYKVVDALNAAPETFKYDFGSVVVDGGAFMELSYLLLYSGDTAGDLPTLIQDTHDGKLNFVRSMAPALSFVPDINLAVFYSIQCREETPFDTYEHALRAAAELPPSVVDYYVRAFAKFHFDLCASWKVEPAGTIESQAVVSDVPKLVLAGQFDPITPPAWGRSTAESLSNSFFYEFPGLGHGVMRANACGLEIGLQFIDDPTVAPDTACIDTLPAPEFH